MIEAPVELKTVKVSEVIDAVKQNGFEHLRGEWIHSVGGKITGGCVLGQGAVNLGILSHDDTDETTWGTLYTALKQFKIRSNNKWVKKAREWNIFPETNEETGKEGWNAALMIISLNDASYYPDYPTDPYRAEYRIKTYAEVAQMVEDILTPFANKEIYVLVQDYSDWSM